MADHKRSSETSADSVLEAEKGKNLSPRNLHLRLRVVEVVLLVTVLLNLLHWVVAGVNDKEMSNRLDAVQTETGVSR